MSKKGQVETYFDLETDEETRAQLEEFISDDDIAAQLGQIKHQEKFWPYMIEQNEQRLKLVDNLKAKRAEAEAA